MRERVGDFDPQQLGGMAAAAMLSQEQLWRLVP